MRTSSELGVCEQMTIYCIACQCFEYSICDAGGVTSGSTSGEIQI